MLCKRYLSLINDIRKKITLQPLYIKQHDKVQRLYIPSELLR